MTIWRIKKLRSLDAISIMKDGRKGLSSILKHHAVHIMMSFTFPKYQIMISDWVFNLWVYIYLGKLEDYI